ncbi:hypothetical protein BH09PSE4_BH09PSE4_08650 [soil metagenome]
MIRPTVLAASTSAFAFAVLASQFAVGATAPVSVPAATPPAHTAIYTWQRWCAPCHAPGPGHPGTAALAVKYSGSLPPELESRRDLDPDTIKYFIRHGVSVMPMFRKTEISDAEMGALADYLTAHNPKTTGKAKTRR